MIYFSRGNKLYSKPFRASSNSARDQLIKERDSSRLGEEPTVNINVKTFKGDKLSFESLTRRRKKEEIKKIDLKERICPDPTLYEDIVENLNVRPQLDDNLVEGNPQNGIQNYSEEVTETKPFWRLEKFLFSCFTACTPWCLMRKIYWRIK